MSQKKQKTNAKSAILFLTQVLACRYSASVAITLVFFQTPSQISAQTMFLKAPFHVNNLNISEGSDRYEQRSAYRHGIDFSIAFPSLSKKTLSLYKLFERTDGTLIARLLAADPPNNSISSNVYVLDIDVEKAVIIDSFLNTENNSRISSIPKESHELLKRDEITANGYSLRFEYVFPGEGCQDPIVYKLSVSNNADDTDAKNSFWFITKTESRNGYVVGSINSKLSPGCDPFASEKRLYNYASTSFDGLYQLKNGTIVTVVGHSPKILLSLENNGMTYFSSPNLLVLSDDEYSALRSEYDPVTIQHKLLRMMPH
jgi:hypothetical protein